MSETSSHKRAKGAAAGSNEVSISRNRRIDSMSTKRATEVERGNSLKSLEKAASRLRATRKSQKILIVPNQNIPKGIQAMRNKGTHGTVRNMAGTRRRSV